MKLFVYGTLLSPFTTASLIPPDALRQPAVTIGRMYHYKAGCYPAITIPHAAIRASGSTHYDRDEAVERGLDSVQAPFSLRSNRKKYGPVHGELVEFDNLGDVMPALDRYEGFREDDPLYRRSLVSVCLHDRTVWTWVYHFDENYVFDWNSFVRVPGGDWISFLRGDAMRLGA